MDTIHRSINPYVPHSIDGPLDYTEEIRHVEFILEEPASTGQRYQLRINFLSEDQSKKIEYIFAVFHPLNPLTLGNNENLLSFVRKIEQLQPNKIIDIYPLNGTNHKKKNVFLKNLIRQEDAKNLKSHLNLIENAQEKSVSLFVLDIKDQSGKYADINDIKEGESSVAEFFRDKEPKDKSPRKEAHQLLNSRKINYFIAEGSLKARLIQDVFTAKQAHFFQETKSGRDLLCQLCEFMMNGFKQGCEIHLSKITLHPGDYIKAIHLEQEGHLPTDLSCWNAVKLHTFYSPDYKEAYSKEGPYFKAINHLFNTEHQYDEATQTTTIIM